MDVKWAYERRLDHGSRRPEEAFQLKMIWSGRSGL